MTSTNSSTPPLFRGLACYRNCIVMSYIKVEGRPNLVRDTESGAILNTNRTAVENYYKIREKHEKKDKQIAQMQSDIDELKQLVKQLVEKENG